MEVSERQAAIMAAAERAAVEVDEEVQKRVKSQGDERTVTLVWIAGEWTLPNHYQQEV